MIQAILIAVSLCADCFAVSLCSSVTLNSLRWHFVMRVALAFAVIQASLLAAGWIFGYLFVGLVEKISHIIAFLLLLYVGGGMLIDGIKALRAGVEDDPRNLNGLKNVIVGGVATSIDALAVGAAQSMTGADFRGVLPLLVAVFVVTMLSVISGICCGKFLGRRFGHWAEFAGGVVLIYIGVGILL